MELPSSPPRRVVRLAFNQKVLQMDLALATPVRLDRRRVIRSEPLGHPAPLGSAARRESFPLPPAVGGGVGPTVDRVRPPPPPVADTDPLEGRLGAVGSGRATPARSHRRPAAIVAVVAVVAFLFVVIFALSSSSGSCLRLGFVFLALDLLPTLHSPSSPPSSSPSSPSSPPSPSSSPPIAATLCAAQRWRVKFTKCLGAMRRGSCSF